MPRYNVQNENGEWACFSSIVDDFITEFMPRAEYQAWREKEYGIHCGEIEEANIMDYHEAMETALCKRASNKGYDLDDVPDFGCPCDYCKFQNKETKKCEIVERQDEIETDGYDH
ncbi:MAG: hypothetical protein NC131_18455 [Roseburia sp.]|nr:hypothetical protein [Roseburia sp.]